MQAAEAGARIKRAVTPAATLAHMTQLIMPQHANSLGITFGGQVTPLYYPKTLDTQSVAHLQGLSEFWVSLS